MLYQYATVLIGLVFGALFVVLNINIVGRLLAPRVDDPEKTTSYECGEPAVGSAWVRFDMRFYTMALVFLIFEVETVFMYPWAAVYKRLRDLGGEAHGGFALLEIVVFIAILGVGFVYVWAKGDLDWVKSTLTSKADNPDATEKVGAVR